MPEESNLQSYEYKNHYLTLFILNSDLIHHTLSLYLTMLHIYNSITFLYNPPPSLSQQALKYY